MCDHCWRAPIPEGRLYVLKCPNCLSDQPGDDELTPEELQAQAETCRQTLVEEEARIRKARLVERARLRMYDGTCWAPQLASAQECEFALRRGRE